MCLDPVTWLLMHTRGACSLMSVVCGLSVRSLVFVRSCHVWPWKNVGRVVTCLGVCELGGGQGGTTMSSHVSGRA